MVNFGAVQDMEKEAVAEEQEGKRREENVVRGLAMGAAGTGTAIDLDEMKEEVLVDEDGDEEEKVKRDRSSELQAAGEAADIVSEHSEYLASREKLVVPCNKDGQLKRCQGIV